MSAVESKPMSEKPTPLTDKEAFCPDDGHGPVVDADFARRLERALAGAEEALRRRCAADSATDMAGISEARAALAQIEELRK